jgi:hypothetical protein
VHALEVSAARVDDAFLALGERVVRATPTASSGTGKRRFMHASTGSPIPAP